MARSVTDALRSLPIREEDRAAVQLLREYARLLDDGLAAHEGIKTFGAIGPRFLATLRELGATPAGRRAMAAGADPGQGDDERGPDPAVVDLRERARTRRRRAAPVDQATP
jgi:hypothetical protein